MSLEKTLKQLADTTSEYRYFNARTVATVDIDHVIGVRVPKLRKLAAQMHRDGSASAFLQELPHFFLEENEVHAYLLNYEKDFGAAVAALDAFLPYVDNWAVCDALDPKAFAQADTVRLIQQAARWMSSEHAFTRRFGISIHMRHLLDTSFEPPFLEDVCAADDGSYYVRMMIAWYLATALDKQWNSTEKLIAARTLDPWIQNKAIQKARESRVIPEERKEHLRGFRLKATRSSRP
ncbi:MAG: DNA alkylation repair protein [Atopobiaceae bacterium]|jgi:3-methyladenine DNA glycosylase AlkD